MSRGKSYTLKLRHTGTNRSSDDGPDFDWQLLVNGSAATGLRQGLYGTGALVIEDPDELLPQLFNGDAANLAKGCEGKIIVPGVKELWVSSPVGTSSSSPGVSMETFKGQKTDFGDPCSASELGQALVVFYKDVENPDYSVKDFDVELSAWIHPVLSPYSPLNALLTPSWKKASGPNSGSFDQTNQKTVTYQNPKEGGLYKFEFELNGSCKSGANVLLPLGGPDVTAYFMSEVARYDAWYAELVNRSFADNMLPPEIQTVLFLDCFKGTQEAMKHSGEDYKSGDSPCERYCAHTVTISGHVFGKDQIGNFLYAYCCAKTWLNLSLTQFASHVYHLWKKGGKLDDPEDIAAMAAGYQLGLTPNVDFKVILETCGTPITDMQSESAKRGWPSKDVGTGKTFPAYIPSL